MEINILKKKRLWWRIPEDPLTCPHARLIFWRGYNSNWRFWKRLPPPESTKIIPESPDLSASPNDILNKLHTCQTHPRIQLMDIMWPSLGNVLPREFRRGPTQSQQQQCSNNALYVACDQPLAQVGHYEISGVVYHIYSMPPDQPWASVCFDYLRIFFLNLVQRPATWRG